MRAVRRDEEEKIAWAPAIAVGHVPRRLFGRAKRL